ncbi:DMT family transporter [Conexibacter sp. SYSU D00693]|uniref:DMT family transporter n=1 Tax=Conexibacter sp. SYSU D00693 TaxID=2812560 RepID=UPI00196B3530|nr:DMT family transporter [Conexibacter sp. SYSU D00693]
MDRGAAVVTTAVVGGLIALQAPINSNLGRHVGTFQAAFVSFAVGTLLLLAIAALAKGGLGGIGGVRDLSSPGYLLGGVLGAAYVATALVTVRSLGAGGVTAVTIAGQLTMSVALDHFGALGVEKDPVTASRLLGVALLALGVFLVVRDG